MKYNFFGSNVQSTIPLSCFLIILRYLPQKELNQLWKVNKTWFIAISDLKRTIPLLPTLDSIPVFENTPIQGLKVTKLSGGMTNITCKISFGGRSWVLRIGGEATELFINRKSESYNAKIAAELGLNAEVLWTDTNSGNQLTAYLDNSRPLSETSWHTPPVLKKIATLLRLLHSHTREFVNQVDIRRQSLELYELVLSKRPALLGQNAQQISHQMQELGSLLSRYRVSQSPCHNDPTPSNFLLSSDQLYLLDWEYSGNNDKLWDLVYLSVEAGLNEQEEVVLLSSYFGESPNEYIEAWFYLYKPIITWWITLWSWVQITNGSQSCPVSEYESLAEKNLTKTLGFLDNPKYHQSLHLLTMNLHEGAEPVCRSF